jgi:polysaccharide export outer membrane protein
LSPEAIAAGVASAEDYIIGADDLLEIVFWRDKDMSAEVVVRPDGKISLPLINEIMAAGLTPTDLRVRITAEASRYLEQPQVTVVVNSRRVYITGEVGKPGPYPLTTPMTVLQLIAAAGGLSDYARREDIIIMRTENGIPRTYTFDYESVSRRRKLGQNILLKPGDTVVVA